MNIFRLLTPITYWILIGLWLFILVFYARRIRSNLLKKRLISTLIIILAIDAFRTLFESLYFGAWYTALAGFLPMEVHSFLIRPEMVFIPKILNVIAAAIIIAILILRWLPQEEQEKEELNRLVRKSTRDLTRSYEKLHTEVSQRRQAQSRLQTYAQNLKIIFDSTPNILVLVNEDARVDMINHRGSTLLGKEKEGILGLLGGEVFNCLNSFHGDGCGNNDKCHHCPVRSRVRSTFETGSPRSEEEGRMTLLLDGREKTMDLLISTAILEMEGERKVLLSLTDISARKRADEELEFQAMLLDQIQDHITATDIDGNIVYVNAAVIRSTGRSREELLTNPEAVFGEDPLKGATQNRIMENTLQNGTWRGEIVYFSRDDQEMIMDCRTRVLKDNSGEPVGMVGISSDITERKKMKERIQQAQKMESIGNLAGGIAHDFNNLLFPIVGMAEMLLEDLHPGSAEYENAEEILVAGRRGSELVKRILAFSRQTEHKMTPTRMQTVLEEVLKLSRSTIPANIEIDQRVQNNCGMVHADPTQLHQVAMNLITNAYHAVEETGGKLSVKFGEIKLSQDDLHDCSLQPGKYVMLSVSDNGSGISPFIKDKIFEPYFTTKEKGKGTGIGLAMVYGIVQEHKGDITVHSDPGNGTTFNVFLPLIEKPAGILPAGKSEKIETGTERLLLVDDEVPIVRLGKQMLERLGYQVSERSSSVDALEAFRATPNAYDLVITDLSMPYLTGIQLARELLAIRPDIAIILCTGFSDKINKVAVKGAGIKATLMKPVLKSELAQSVRKVLDEAQSKRS